jgi:DNA-binding LacI/PurR family transcriptional regulator
MAIPHETPRRNLALDEKSNEKDAAQASSLRDIAREAGVSISTVSRVLSGGTPRAKISDATRERILAICEAMRFHPNVNYRRLKEGLSRVIAFLIPPRTSSSYLPFFDESVGTFLSSFEPRLSELGFDIIIQSVTPDYIQQRKHLEMLRNRSIDGLICWNSFMRDEDFSEIVQERCPVLSVAFPNDALPDQIVPDNFQGSRDLTRHLIGLGHTRIAFISGGNERVDKLREAGHLAALEEGNLEPCIYRGNYTLRRGYELTTEIHQQQNKASAIFAANDLMAAGCLRRLRELGYRVPEDMAIVGFDFTSHSLVTNPPLTTASLELGKIGRLAADRIYSAISSPQDYIPEVTVVPIPIIERASTLGRDIKPF